MARRIVIAVALLLVALPAVLVAAVLAAANTDWGRARIVATVESVTADGPVRVRIGRLDGMLPVRVEATGVQLSDAAGVFAAFERVAIGWSPGALLAGTVAVDVVEVAGGRILRVPDLPADSADPESPAVPSLAFPAPPVAVRLQALRIDGLALDEALAGRAATVAADLSAAVTEDSATARGWLTAATGGGTARLDLDLAVVPADGTLRAELRASEPAGGLVAGLLGLPNRPALDLAVTGAGTLADWKGRLAGGFGPGAGVDLALAAATSPAGTRVGVDGTVSVPGLVPDAARPLVGPSADLDLTTLLAADGSVRVERLTVRTPAATADATARIDAEGVPVELDATVRAPDLAMFSDLAGAALSGAVDGRLTLGEGGRHAAIRVTGAPVLDGAAIRGLTAALSASADRPLSTLPDSLTWTLEVAADTPEQAGPDLAGLLGPRVALQASGTAGTDGALMRADRVALTTDVARLDASAELTDGRRIAAAGAVDVADLDRFTALAGRKLAGSARLDFDGTVLLDPFDLSAVLDLAAAGLDLGDPALTALVGDAPAVGAGVTLDSGNRLSIHGLSLRVAAVQAGGDAGIDLAGGGLDGRVDLTAPDLAAIGRALAVDLGGSATAAIALGGTLQAPTASASWRAAPLSVQGAQVAEVTGSATAVDLPASPSGRLDLRAVSGGEAVTLGAGYALAGDILTIRDLTLDGAGLQARGGAAVDLAGPAVDGELRLSAPDLGRVGAVAGVALSGGPVEASVTLVSGGGQSARLSATVTRLAIDGGTEIAEIELSGEGRNLLRRPAGTLQATAGGLRQDGEMMLETARLVARSDGSTAQVETTLKGAAGQPFELTATASAALDAVPLQASVDTLQASIADARVSLQRPTRITLGLQPRFDDLDLTVDDGRITGSGRLDPRDLDITVAVRGLPAGLARLADPTMKVAGGIDADLSVRGAIGDPVARLAVSAPALRSTDPTLADLPPLQATAEITVEARKLTATLDAAVGDGVRATLRATAGLMAGGASAPPTLDERAPLQARLDAEAALDRLSAFLPLDGGRIAGQASVHVAVAGTPADPAVDGSATLRDGVVEHPTLGLYLQDMVLEARGQGERLVIEQLTAAAAGGGTLEGSGGISFDVAEGAPVDIRLAAQRLRAVDTDQAEVDVDADLTLQGSLPTYRLAGSVTVLPSEIRIPDQLPPSVVELEVTEVRDGVVIRSPDERKPEQDDGDAPVLLDVAVAIPGQVFIRGRGLDSEWGGDLAVTGPADAPVVRGTLAVRRGQLGAVGRTFAFQHGRVVFDGGPPGDPALDMVLSTEVAEILAKVEVSGRAQDPRIDLTSEPALPEEEVLSRVLFGSSRAQLSPLQALKLAQSAAVLSGRLGAGGGITDRVRETLGVDTLDVDAGDGGEGSRGASLSVGKYVAPGVFLKLQQGLSGVGSKAVVEVELTDSITVETDVGADSQSRVGVNWKLDY